MNLSDRLNPLTPIGEENAALRAEMEQLRAETQTWRAEAERARAAEHDLTELLDRMPSVIGYWDRELRNRFGNRGYGDWFGIEPGVLRGRTMPEVIGAELFRSNRRYVDGALAGRPQSFERTLPKPDGSGMCYLLVNYLPDVIDGEVRGFYVLVSDVTAVKEAEAARSGSERLLGSIFDILPVGITITDAEGQVIDCNHASEALLGVSKVEQLSRHIAGSEWNIRRTDGTPMPPEEFASVRAMREGRAVHGVEMELVTPHGSTWLSVSATPIGHPGLGAAVVYVDISERKRAEAELNRIAYYDMLTGVANRRLFFDRLNRALPRMRRGGRQLAVCHLDIDNFKLVNDRFGHETGDRLLLEVARDLEGALRGGDTVARFGGDEFVLLITDLADAEECFRVLDRLLARVARTVTGEGHPVAISASIGGTLFPEDDSDADTLLRHADQAMYRAKEAGRNRYQLFDSRHERELRSHREFLSRMGSALAADEFVLFYQPKVNLLTGEVIGAEALIRWRHQERGIVSPGEFLPQMMGSPLEVQLGEWVLDAVLAQIADWKRRGLRIPVSANISAEHLLSAEFIPRLTALLGRYPMIAAGDLELEILESAAIGDVEQASRTLEAGIQLGVRFSLDDFGTGYSSLTYFRRLPIETVKIDQTFVRDMLEDPEDLNIVESVIYLARAFNRPVIAEGVETLEHGAVLLRLGCELAQGYGIARPMPPGQLTAWIEKWRAEAPWRGIAVPNQGT